MIYAIRAAIRADLPLLAQVERNAAALFAQDGSELAWLAHGEPLPLSTLQALQQHGGVWVAADGQDRPSGFLATQPLDGQMFIVELSVALPQQRQGHGRQAREHFLGGFIRKRHGQDAGRRYLLGLDQPRDAGGQHAGLARTGASEDQRMLSRQGDGSQLFGIEVVKKILHPVIIPTQGRRAAVYCGFIQQWQADSGHPCL